MNIIISLVISYLIGSLSGSLILGKIKNIDLRKHGSGNAGGTNTFRIIGPLSALFVTIFDPSSIEAILFGPNILILFFSKKSTTPSTKGFSGPTTNKSS